MALKIENEKIVGTIDNLQEKLEGKLPVDRLELLYLVNSWGRIDFFYTEYLDEDVKIEECKATQSEQAFYQNATSNPLLVKKLVRNVTSMNSMFYQTKKFNSDISNWDVSNIITMDYMFANTKKFNQNISNWNLEKIRLCEDMFDNANAFLDKYNDGEELPYHTDHIIEWIINNREKMNLISIKDMHGKEIDGFFHAIRFYSQNRNR